MRASKLTIGRLYNLGNYEHVRYEVTVEIDEGDSASHALQQTQAILDALNPRPVGVPSISEVMRDEAQYERESKWSAQEFHRYHGEVAGGPTAYFERIKQVITEKKAKHDAWRKEVEKARAAFDELGGAAIYKDAKPDWRDYSDEDNC